MLQVLALISRVLHPKSAHSHFVDENGRPFRLQASMVAASDEVAPSQRYRFLDENGKTFELRPPDESILRTSPVVSAR